MPAHWIVNKNTGDLATVSYSYKRMEVPRPKSLTTNEFRDLLKPGTVVLDRVLQTLHNW